MREVEQLAASHGHQQGRHTFFDRDLCKGQGAVNGLERITQVHFWVVEVKIFPNGSALRGCSRCLSGLIGLTKEKDYCNLEVNIRTTRHTCQKKRDVHKKRICKARTSNTQVAGVIFSSRPPRLSSNSQIAPFGPCSTSRMRWPISKRSASWTLSPLSPASKRTLTSD